MDLTTMNDYNGPMSLIRAAIAYAVFLLAWPVLLLHPKLRRGFAERLGFHKRDWLAEPPADGVFRVWMHGASAGDILALLPTVRELRKMRPDVEIILSTITDSGRVIAERERDQVAAVTYLPWDLPGSVARTLRRIRPHLLLLEYTELWPTLIHAAAARNIPVVLHNGRFSQARLNRYRRLFWLAGNLLKQMRMLLMRDEHEADRAVALGAAPDRIRVTGNTKFDSLRVEVPEETVTKIRAATGLSGDAPLWVAGSTHEGEEELLLDLLPVLRKRCPELRMLIAPRYTDRGERIATLAGRRGLSWRLRSQGAAPNDPAADVTVLDTIGELSAAYAIADVVFVGGSFVSRGGQNILEPAACGKPVTFGPNMQNFADSVQVLLGRGGIQVASPPQLARVLGDLLAKPDDRDSLGTMARDAVMQVRGAAARNAEAILSLLNGA